MAAKIITFDDAAAAAHAYEAWEAPRWRRRDGSHTNW